MTPDPRRARLEELLGIEATQGLSPAETAERDALLEAFPDEDPDGLELAAAAVHLALAPPPEEMPTAVAKKVHRAALGFIPPPPSPRSSRPRPAWVMWSGWVVAAGLAGVLVWTQWPVSLARQRERLERDQTAAARPYAGEKPGVSGTIVWSGAKQEGYMELHGLAPIDPGAGTYQLWIVDGDRKDSAPVDGGVFKVNPDGTALVRIRAPIRVKNAVAFAITKEKEPGGVVVSQVKPENYELVLTPKQG